MHRNSEGSIDRRRHPGRMIVGLLLVAWGGISLLETLGFSGFHGVARTYWPLIIIGWGLSGLLSPNRHLLPAGGAMLLGTVLLGNQLAWWHVTARTLGPLLIMAIGLSLLFRRRPSRRARVTVQVGLPSTPVASDSRSPGPDDREWTPRGPTGGGAQAAGGDDLSATLQEFALMGGVDRRNTSQSFRGGEVTAILGGVKLDLRDCRMATDSAQIEVMACMGGVALQIPREWSVESHVTAVLGGLDDRSAPPLGGTVTGRLILTGQAVLGGIEIKN